MTRAEPEAEPAPARDEGDAAGLFAPPLAAHVAAVDDPDEAPRDVRERCLAREGFVRGVGHLMVAYGAADIAYIGILAAIWNEKSAWSPELMLLSGAAALAVLAMRVWGRGSAFTGAGRIALKVVAALLVVASVPAIHVLLVQGWPDVAAWVRDMGPWWWKPTLRYGFGGIALAMTGIAIGRLNPRGLHAATLLAMASAADTAWQVLRSPIDRLGVLPSVIVFIAPALLLVAAVALLWTERFRRLLRPDYRRVVAATAMVPWPFAWWLWLLVIPIVLRSLLAWWAAAASSR